MKIGIKDIFKAKIFSKEIEKGGHKMKKYGKGGLGGFLAGKGFYAAMAVCLLGAVGAAWVTASRAIDSVSEKENVSVPENRVISEEKYDPNESLFAAEDVAKPKEDVKVEESDETKSNAETSKNSFAMPIKGKIISNHSGGELVKYDALDEWRTHDGVDIECDVGADISASFDGKISGVTNDPLWGTVVEISHSGNIVTVYSGLEENVSVKVGDEVKTGDVIGKLGETNLAETDKATHLHFAIKENGKFIDPMIKLG